MTGRPPLRRGTVVEFDDHVGLGVVECAGRDGEGGRPAGAGPARYGFHCTQIAGGTRTIAVGTAVTFGLLPGRGGRWEAADVTPEDLPPKLQ
ncbi:MAG: hypothetical protein ACRDWW_03325 [Acidimicrobiales bacterium]